MNPRPAGPRALRNSTAPEIGQRYDGNAEPRRAVNSKASGRGVVDEYLGTNVERRDESVALRPGRQRRT